MPEKKDGPDLGEKTLDLGKQVFDAFWNSNGSHDLWHWLLMIVVCLVALGVALTLMFKAIVAVAEALAKLFEGIKASGLPLLLNRDNKNRVRLRKQFCGVLDGDLKQLAKAESWNDQYFTDLEAEVETDGGYYASALDRLRGRKSSGLRKEKSLVRAITSSTERAMQLVGEPGSGKSVALRHLAMQLATRGQKSNDKDAIIPIYVNLREIDIPPGTAVTADAIRAFVLDNIRRGDADTSAYVRNNWEDYVSRGIWLFLFDSFDEIPAVLHAGANSSEIREYSKAIRQFLEGMGECKGILASREFKGPEALPWKKLRILPLSGAKQDELIQNSVLSPEQMDVARLHLATSHSSIGATPLFLTLLCRYVKDEKRAPNSDHDILMMHVERLAGREPDYLRRKYQLSVTQLLDGAERLARLFAEDDAMSLAPTLDQIVEHLGTESVPGGSVERLISALVDCKVGRADVQNAKQGDRRFAFAHRRYQEALFVRYLASHPDALSPRELLTEPRWREYTVTLLQTHPLARIALLLDAAAKLLHASAATQAPIAAEAPLPSSLGYFSWEAEPAVPLLALLQEGMARRPKDVTPELGDAVQRFLGPRLAHGDSWDRAEALRLGGLMPQPLLIGCLTEAFDHGTRIEQGHAFSQAAFVSDLPKSARKAVLEKLANQLIFAQDRATQISLEALAARLPAALGADHVVARCKRLRKRVRGIAAIGRLLSPLEALPKLMRILTRQSSAAVEFSSMDVTPKLVLASSGMLALTGIFAFSLVVWLGGAKGFAPLVNEAIGTALALLFLLFLCVALPFLVRAQGHRVGLRDAVAWLLRPLFWRAIAFAVAGLLVAGAVFTALALALGFAVHWLLHGNINLPSLALAQPSKSDLMGIGVVSSLAMFYVLLIPTSIWGVRRVRAIAHASAARLASLKASHPSDIAILLEARGIGEATQWLSSGISLQMPGLRGFSTFVTEAMRADPGLRDTQKLPGCLRAKVNQLSKARGLRQLLEDSLLHLVRAGETPG